MCGNEDKSRARKAWESALVQVRTNIGGQKRRYQRRTGRGNVLWIIAGRELLLRRATLSEYEGRPSEDGLDLDSMM